VAGWCSLPEDAKTGADETGAAGWGVVGGCGAW
jgi:hypothetical protein